MLKLFLVALFGRLLIFLIQLFPYPRVLEKVEFLKKLYSCDLCLGVYVFTLLAWAYKLDILQLLGLFYVPVLSEILSGMFLSFMVYIFRIGWNERFSNITYTVEE